MHFFRRKPKVRLSSYDENIVIPADKLMDSLRPMFAAHPDVDELRLNVISELFHDGEPYIAFDMLIENLNDMNFDKIVAPLSTEQAQQTRELIQKLYSRRAEKAQEYLAVVDRITETQQPSPEESFLFHKSSLGLTGAHRFFFMYLYNDSLDDMESIEEAVEMYLQENLDPNGALLLKETTELLQKNMSEKELSVLIEEEWNADVESSDVGSWHTVLQRIHDILVSRQKIDRSLV